MNNKKIDKILVLEYIQNNPGLSYKKIADFFNISRQRVHQIVKWSELTKIRIEISKRGLQSQAIVELRKLNPNFWSFRVLSKLFEMDVKDVFTAYKEATKADNKMKAREKYNKKLEEIKNDPEKLEQFKFEMWDKASRARGGKGKVNFKHWKTLLNKWGKKCLSCKTQKPTDGFVIDHIIPLKKGGEHKLDNLQLLCHRCNSVKGSRTIDYR